MNEASTSRIFLAALFMGTSRAFLPTSMPQIFPSRVWKLDSSAIHPTLTGRTQLNLDLEASFLEPFHVLQGAASPLVQQISQTLVLPPVETLTTTHLIQTAGETSFFGMLGVAALQGALVMKQYQTNPAGGLIVPPGLTVGDEDAKKPHSGSSHVVGFFDGPVPKNNAAFGMPKRERFDAKIEDIVCDTDDSALACHMKKQWYHTTTQILAIAMIPLAAVAGPSLGLASWMVRYGHIMHIAVIFGLSHVYDFFRQLPAMESYQNNPDKTTGAPPYEEEPIFAGVHPRVMVLGDSMAVGIGTCEVFDDQKVYDIPLHKQEHVTLSEQESKSSENLPGPLFPKVLAKTLSERFQKPVAWRSAGVDGGSTMEIAELLLGVLQDEVDRNRAPDLLVVLTGSNDLKHILNGEASVKGFRSNLMELAKEIQKISPKTRVVFPALPTPRGDPGAIMNIFPLSFFLDGVMGVWDAQKMAVADKCPGVLHVDLTVADVNGWYKGNGADDSPCGDGPVSLIAADGIHPNARCYMKWGAFVGNSLADQLLGQPSKQEKQHTFEGLLTPLHRGHLLPNYGTGFAKSATDISQPNL